MIQPLGTAPHNCRFIERLIYLTPKPSAIFCYSAHQFLSTTQHDTKYSIPDVAMNRTPCQNSSGDSLYECIEYYIYGQTDSTSYRGLDEVAVRSLGIHIVALSAYGHLMSLQGYGRRNSTLMLIYILMFFLFPFLPIVQAASYLIKASAKAIPQRKTCLRFLLAACLGQCLDVFVGRHAGKPSWPTPISHLDPSKTCPQRLDYNALWFGRMLLQLAMLAQFVGTIVLTVRGLSVFNGAASLWWIDYRNAHIAFGALICVVMSIGISLLNTKWNNPVLSDELLPSNPTDMQLGSHPPAPDAVTDNEAITFPVDPQGGQPRTLSKFNETISHRLTTRLPPYIQSQLDTAFLLQLLWLLWWGRIHVHLSSSQISVPLLLGRKHDIRLKFSYIPFYDINLATQTEWLPFIIIYYLAIAQVILRYISRIAIFPAPHLAKKVYFWTLSGRSIPSIILYLCLLSLFALDAYVLSRQFGVTHNLEKCFKNVQDMEVCQMRCFNELHTEAGRSLVRKWWFMKDPLADRMYVM